MTSEDRDIVILYNWWTKRGKKAEKVRLDFLNEVCNEVLEYVAKALNEAFREQSKRRMSY
jgi:hypothetical protein